MPHSGVVKWLDTTPEASRYVSVLTLAEIEKGILRKEEGKRRHDLQRWFDEDLPARFAGRILAFDARVPSCWAHLIASLLDKGASPSDKFEVLHGGQASLKFKLHEDFHGRFAAVDFC